MEMCDTALSGKMEVLAGLLNVMDGKQVEITSNWIKNATSSTIFGYKDGPKRKSLSLLCQLMSGTGSNNSIKMTCSGE